MRHIVDLLIMQKYCRMVEGLLGALFAFLHSWEAPLEKSTFKSDCLALVWKRTTTMRLRFSVFAVMEIGYFSPGSIPAAI